VQAELIQQVLLFIAHNRTVGMEAVTRFLRPFFMFTVIHKPISVTSSAFGRDLISAVASLSCSFPTEAISIIKLLTECLKFSPCTNEVVTTVFLLFISYFTDAFKLASRSHINSTKINTITTISVDQINLAFKEPFPADCILARFILNSSKN